MIKFESLKLNIAGLRQMRRSEPFMELVESHAKDIKNQCGDGYETSSNVGRSRANARVYTQTYEAMQDNLDNNTLLKAVGSGI